MARKTKARGQHMLVVVKVAIKEDAEKLLGSDSVTFRGGAVIILLFEERRTPVACFKCSLGIERETICDQRRAIYTARKAISSARQLTYAV